MRALCVCTVDGIDMLILFLIFVVVGVLTIQNRPVVSSANGLCRRQTLGFFPLPFCSATEHRRPSVRVEAAVLAFIPS